MTLIAGMALSCLPPPAVVSEGGYTPPLLFLMAAVSVIPHVSQLRNFAFDRVFPFLVPAGSNITS